MAVMPTHVHVLATPLQAAPGEWYSLSEILHSIKRASARYINVARGQNGPVWSVESYDHIIRDEREWSATFDYLLANAVEEGYTGDPYEYDGFWCESMEGLASESICLPSTNTADAPEVGSHPLRVREAAFVQRRRRLPHWESPGASYHVVFGLRSHRVSPPSPAGGSPPITRGAPLP